jgi:hypothetical protein
MLIFNSNIKKTLKSKIYEFNLSQSTAIFGSQSVPDRSPKMLDRDQKIFDRNLTFSDFDRKSDLPH